MSDTQIRRTFYWQGDFFDQWVQLIKINQYDNLGYRPCSICWGGVRKSPSGNILRVCPYCNVCASCFRNNIDYFAFHKVYCSN